MSKLLLLYLTFVLGLLFLLIPMKQEMMDFFPFSDFQIYPVNHIYYICEKMVVIILAGIIATEATEYRKPVLIFFILCVADLADYLLSYSSVWFRIGEFPISMNILKSTIFGLTIIRELWNKQHIS